LRKRLLSLVLLAALLPGCAAPRPSPPAPPAEKPIAAPELAPSSAPAPEPAPEPAPVPPPVPAPPSPADKAFSEGMATLQAGGHEKALELFAAAWKEKPGHAGVSQEFDGALLALKKNGDAAYEQGKMEDAGKRWMATLRYINHPAAKPKSYPFTRSDVQAQVDRLTAGLMEKSLQDHFYKRFETEQGIRVRSVPIELPDQWARAVAAARTNTAPFDIVTATPPDLIQHKDILLPMSKASLAVAGAFMFTSMLASFSVPLMIGSGEPPQMVMIDVFYRINYQGDYGTANALGVVSYLLAMGVAGYYLRTISQK